MTTRRGSISCGGESAIGKRNAPRRELTLRVCERAAWTITDCASREGLGVWPDGCDGIRRAVRMDLCRSRLLTWQTWWMIPAIRLGASVCWRLGCGVFLSVNARLTRRWLGGRRRAGCGRTAGCSSFVFSAPSGAWFASSRRHTRLAACSGSSDTGFRCGPTPAQAWSFAVPGGIA